MINLSLKDINTKIETYQYLICDEAVFELYIKDFPAIRSMKIFYLKNPEESKSIKEFSNACDFFLSYGISRNDTIISLGGGATSDFCGYVASSLLRGISWICIPTTILSSIDASIGGKVGINSAYGKNLIGAFHRPSLTWNSDEFFKTLSEREIQSGLGELVKYCFLDRKIREEVLNIKLENSFTSARTFKHEVTSTDFMEDGDRKLLNLGHTLGHCIEFSSNLSHGDSVRLGIRLICELYSPEVISLLDEVELALGLNRVEMIPIDKATFVELLKKDKKVKKNETIDLIIPEINKSIIRNIRISVLINDLEILNENNQIYK